MIKAFHEGDHVYLVSIGEHARIGDLFASNGHLRDKWYHAPVLTDVDSGHPIGVEHGPIKSMEIDDEWEEVRRLFVEEGAEAVAREITAAAGEWEWHTTGHGHGHHHHHEPPPVVGDAVSGEMTFG